MTSRPPVWQLHETRARFSELFRRVRTEGPQRVVNERGEAVVIVPAEVFDRAAECEAQPASLVEFFRTAPAARRALDVSRRRVSTRTIKVVTASRSRAAGRIA